MVFGAPDSTFSGSGLKCLRRLDHGSNSHLTDVRCGAWNGLNVSNQAQSLISDSVT